MSLLADLLAKIKQPPSKREVPPNLRDIVQASARQSGNRRKIILLTCIFGAAVVSGLLLTYFGRSLMDTDSSIMIPAGNFAAKADIPMQRESEAPPAVSTPQSAGQPAEPPAKSDTATPEAENRIPDGPVTVPEPAEEKSVPVTVQLDEEQKKPPVVLDDFPGQARTTAPVRQETAQKTEAFLYAARKYEMNNEYLKALSNYKHALKTETDNVTVMNNIAFLYLKLNLLDDAITYAQMALDRNRDYVPALINIAIAYAQSENYVDAEHSLNHAQDLDPDNESILLNLAVLNERQENFPKALDLYSHLVKLGNSEGFMGEARIHEKQGNTRKAIELYKGIALSESVDDAAKMNAKERIGILLKK